MDWFGLVRSVCKKSLQFFRKIENRFSKQLNYNNPTMTTKTKTSFCKVCFDAKKSKEEYTSHWVKSETGPNGVVVCPYLLSLECRYCKKSGHTPRWCPVMKKRQAARRSRVREPEQVPEPEPEPEPVQEPVTEVVSGPEPEFNICEKFITFRRPRCGAHPKRRINSFDGLDQYSDSDDGSHHAVEVVSQKPLNWADIVSKPPVLKRCTNQQQSSDGEDVGLPDSFALAPDDDAFLRNTATGQKISWADFCDSD